MATPIESLPYQVRIKNFIYDLNNQPYVQPTEEDIDSIEEEEYTVNRFYGEAVRPVIELINMGKIEEAIKVYDTLTDTKPIEPAMVKVKK